MAILIHNSDILTALAGVPDNTYDAAFCDPPYGLKFMGRKWDYYVPSVDLWREVYRTLKPGAPLMAFGGARTYHRLVVAIEDAGFLPFDCCMWLYGKGFPKSANPTRLGASADWSGYGTALKPAYEPCVCAWKPREGTISANVATYGVGALAIDACRVGTSGGTTKGNPPKGASNGIYGDGLNGACDVIDIGAGRWPANLILDEDAAAILDADAGDRPSVAYKAGARRGDVLPLFDRPASEYRENGGPSRFFFCSKVSTRERNAGCEHLPLRSAGECTGRDDDAPGTKHARAGACHAGARNHHPTLKPIALTTYFARLIMPPQPGTLLVPFSGSGSEVIGAYKAGWRQIVGIEREAEYVEICQARVRHFCGVEITP